MPVIVEGDPHWTSRSESERRFSARLAAWPLAALSVLALVGLACAIVLPVRDAMRPTTIAAAYGALSIVAGAAGVLESMRTRWGERLGVLAGALGTGMTWSVVMNGWWVLAPFLGGATLAVLITQGYRFMVRDEAAHAMMEHQHREL